MGNKKQTYVIELDGQISKLENKLNTIKGSLEKTNVAAQFPGLNKALTAAYNQLDKIKQVAAQPAKSSSFTNLGKEAANIGVELDKLLTLFENISKNSNDVKLSLLPPGEQANIQKAIAAITAYNNAIAQTAIKTKEHIQAEDKLAASKNRLAGWEAKLAAFSTSATTLSAEKAKTESLVQETDKRIAEKERELEAQRAAVEELNKLYEDTGTDKRGKISDSTGQEKSLRKERNSLLANEKALEDLKNQKISLTVTSKELDKSIKTNNSNIANATDRVRDYTNIVDGAQQIVDNFEASHAKTSAAQTAKAYEEMAKQARDLGINIDDIELEDLEQASIELKNRLQQLEQDGLDKVNDSTREFVVQTNGAKTAIGSLKDGIEDATESYQQYNEQKERAQQMETWIKNTLGLKGAQEMLTKAIRNAFAAVKELDAQMTEMAVVTDLDVGDYWDQLPEYTQRANDLGVSIKSAYESATLFYQQGLKTNEVVALSNQTLKMARIAGLSAEDATNRMTAALRGFNMELSEANAQNIADVYSELAAITASDVNEISEAMTKTASIAASAGMEFETTAAFLSQIIETTREAPETAGTAMKTIIARFQELKKAPEEIGEVDGEIVDANAIEKALRSVGVSLRDASGQFRELDQVFLELSGKWDSLDKNTQRYIATIAAGSRQQSRFIAMMSDYGRTTELVTAANNSAGASSKQYQKTMDSLETKLTKLKNAWDEFSTGILNSDLVKGAVDFLTMVITALNKVTSTFDGVWGSFAKIATLVSLFQLARAVVTKFFNGLVKSVFDMSKEAGANIAKGANEGLKEEQEKQEKQEQTQKTKEETQTGAQQPTNTSWIHQTGIGKIHRASVDLKDARHKSKFLKGSNKLLTDRKRDKEAALNLAQGLGDTKAVAELETEIAGINTELENNQKLQADVEKQSSQAWSTMAEGVGSAGMALTALGAGFGFVGQMFEQAGMSGAAEVFSGIGQVITMVGGALMILPPIISLVGTVATAAGISTQAAWWWVLIIVAAIVAVAAIVILVAKAIKENSAAYQLEQAQKAADSAADAADRAAESYQNLVDTLDGLEDKYKALEDLTEGTEEWHKAVEEINDSILDLIDEYPELASLVESRDGVLHLDTESQEVQNIINNKKMQAMTAKNNATMAQLGVSRAEDNLAYENLSNGAKLDTVDAVGTGVAAGAGAALAGAGIGAAIGTIIPGVGNLVGAAVGAAVGGIAGIVGGIFTGEAAKNAAFEDTQEATDALALALAEGAVVERNGTYEVIDDKKLAELGLKFDQTTLDNFYKQVGDSTDELKEYGEALAQTRAQEMAAYQAMATQVTSMINTTSWTTEEINQMNNMLDGDTMKAIYEQELSSVKDMDFTNSNEDEEERKLKEEAVKATYGADATYKKGKVKYKNESGEIIEEELSNEAWQSMIASNEATKRAQAAAKASRSAIDKVINLTTEGMSEGDRAKTADAMNKAMEDKTGSNLTKAETDTLLKTEVMSALDFETKLSQAEKDALGGNYVTYVKNLQEAQKAAEQGWNDLADEMGQYGVDFTNLTMGAAKGLINKFEDVANTTGETSAKIVATSTQELLNYADSVGAKQEEIAARINATDWTSIESLNDLQYELINTYGLSEEQVKGYIDEIGRASFATSKFAYTIDNLGEFYIATQKLNKALKDATDAEWEYQHALDGHGKVTQDLISSLVNAQTDAFEAASEMRSAAELDILKAYGSGNQYRTETEGQTFTSEWSLDENNQLVNREGLSMSEFKQQRLTDEQAEQFDEWVQNISDQVDKISEAEDAQKEAIDKLYELQQQSEDSYYELRDMVKEALDHDIQEFIDLQQDEIDATKETADAIANKIQEQINEERQARQNADKVEDIADARQRLSYLKMDTSGMNELEILDLQDEIATMESEYSDSLIDQKLQQFSDDNQLAYDQREEQIRLLQQQATAYQQSEAYQDKVTELVNDLIDGDATVADWLSDYKTTGMSQQEKENWEHEISNTATMAGFFTKGVRQSKASGEIFSEGERRSVIYDKDGNTISESEYNALSPEKQKEYTKGTGTVSFDGNSAVLNYGGGFKKTLASDLGGSTSFESIADAESQRIIDANTDNQRQNRLIGMGYSPVSVAKASNEQLSAMEEIANSIYRYAGSSQAKEKGITGVDSSKLASYLGANSEAILNEGTDFISHEPFANYDLYTKTEEQIEKEKNSVVSSEGEAALQTFAANGYRDGFEGLVENPLFDLLVQQEAARRGISREQAKENMGNRLKDFTSNYKYGSIDSDGDDKWVSKGNWNGWVKNANAPTTGDTKYKLDGKEYTVSWRFREKAGGDYIKDQPTPNPYSWLGEPPQNGWIIASNDTLWTYNTQGGRWGRLASDKNGLKVDYYRKLRQGRDGYQYKTGGLADFTGPAWLDGTKSRPEYVLNSAQTERFFSLVDVLEGFDEKGTNHSSGDVSVDIDINVDKISSDYDVEQLANKIRSMLYKDGMYRNVNTISHTR